MTKVFKFLESLTPELIDLLGHPTVKFYSDFHEVCFKTCRTIKSVSFLNLPADEYRIYADNGSICVVYLFYKS